MARLGLLRRLVALLLCAATTHAATAHALSAHTCARKLRSARSRATRTLSGTQQCRTRGYCGPIPEPPPHLRFSERLSPRCAALFDTYRSRWSRAGLANILPRHNAGSCKPRAVAGASQPLVMSSDATSTFVLCTAPKAGCTNIRKLLFNMILHPRRPLLDALGQFTAPHAFRYPALALYTLPVGNTTAAAAGPAANSPHARRMLAVDGGGVLWQPDIQPPPPMPTATAHLGPETGPGAGLEAAGAPSPVADDSYAFVPGSAQDDGGEDEQPQLGAAARAARSQRPLITGEVAGGAPAAPPRLPEGVPSFTFGRNPYVRLLSGFRDKMVHNPERQDQYTVRHVNEHLAVSPRSRWADTPEAFRTFVRTLFKRGVAGVDFHFLPAADVCGGRIGMRFEYYLRLEEMAEWFPCWMDGLGLREWTESGWADTPHGRMYVGRGPGETFVTLNAFGSRKKLHKRPVWDARRGAASSGTRGVDWDLVTGDQCWWAPKGMTCSEYYASFTAPDGSVVPGELGREEEEDVAAAPHAAVAPSQESSGRQRDTHDTNSQDSWELFYDQETADLAYLMYAVDFEAFGYERAVIPA